MTKTSRSFTAVVSLLIILAGCGMRKDVTESSSGGTSDQVTAFTQVNLIPMTDDSVVENQTVLVKGTRIIEIGPSHGLKLPENAFVIDGAGAYLMPGLADMHMHTRADWLSDVWPVSPLKLYLANGVTTIRDFGPKGRPLTYALRWRDKIKKRTLDGPTVYASGIRPGHPGAGPDWDPQRIVQWNYAQGFDFLKVYSFLSPGEFHKAMTAAKQLHMYTTGHIPFSVGLDGVISEGIDEIAHIEELDFEFLDFDRNRRMDPRQWFLYIIDTAVKQYKASFDLDVEGLKKRGGEAISAVVSKLQIANIPICTTLVVGETIVQKLLEPEAFLACPVNGYLPKWYWDAFRQGREKHQVQFRGNETFAPFKYTMERILLSELHKAGIRLVLATDAGTGGMGIVPGFSIHDELRILTENGFTPYEALAAGTVHASKVVESMTEEDDFGSIEVDKRADLILVNSNPLENVANIRDLRGVMAAGRWYSKETLEQIITFED